MLHLKVFKLILLHIFRPTVEMSQWMDPAGDIVVKPPRRRLNSRGREGNYGEGKKMMWKLW